jgi:ArsR family transcriptional regulator, arsenate/arsenite/antimonite-responsive transcriptional repressor
VRIDGEIAEGGCPMTAKDLRRLTKRASLLKSLAHPSRLLIIEMLERSPSFVGELTEAIGADITTVSKHLSVLKRAGLVKATKRGTYSEYSLACDCVNHFIDCIEAGKGSGVSPKSGRKDPGCVHA